MKAKRVFPIALVAFLALFLGSAPIFASGPIMVKDVYNLTKTVVHARQMGVPTTAAERIFWQGVAAYSKNDVSEARKLFGEASRILNWEIVSKRQSYRSVIRSASSVKPISVDGGAVQIWPIMTSENGDMEWNAAVRAVLIAPNVKWDLPQENLERLIYVVDGRGAAVVEGQGAKLFVGDALCIPPNVVGSFETTGFHFPMRLVICETYPDMKHDELKAAENYREFPEVEIKEEVTEDQARSAFGQASSVMEKADSMGIRELYEASLCYDIAQECLRGGNSEGAYNLANLARDQVEGYISDLEAKRALIMDGGVPVSNTAYLERYVFHANTCPAWLLNTGLPVDYTQFLSSFEIEAGGRLGPHVHNQEEFYYVLHGRGLMMVADPIGNRYFEKDQPGVEVNPGDLIRIPPDSLHSIFPAGGGYRIVSLAFGGYSDEAVEVQDIEWSDSYRPE